MVDYQDKETLRRMYYEEDMTQQEMADELGCAESTITRYMRKHDISPGHAGTAGRPGPDQEPGYRDKNTLERLYYDEEMTLKEIAGKFDRAESTISDWMERFDIAPGEEMRIERAKEARRVPYACYCYNGNGYFVWFSQCDGKRRSMRVHRLLAVAEYGVEAVKGMDVHHRNGIKWDNRPANIELKDPSEHRRDHFTWGNTDADQMAEEPVSHPLPGNVPLG